MNTWLSILLGCEQFTAPTPRQERVGLIWVFPGIAGQFTVVDAVRAFRDTGVESAIRVHRWNSPLNALANLMAIRRNRQNAAEVAAAIATYRENHPDQPIDLVGYSGGGGMAILTAEALPDEVRVRNVVLVQPAINPGYDLTTVLAHISGKIIHFHSTADKVILGLGTTLFGNIDRKHSAAAGRNGFDVARSIPDAQKRDRLVQRAWTREMLSTGHWGGHRAIKLYEWNKRYVTPYLLGTDDGRL